MNRIVSTIRAAFHEKGVLQERVELVIYVLIAASIVVLGVQTSLGFDHPVSQVLERIDLVLMLIFAVEVTTPNIQIVYILRFIRPNNR